MMTIENLHNQLATIEDTIGVYKFIDAQGRMLYIGKSIHLKKRIQSYFAKEVRRNKKIKRMIKWIDKIEVEYTDTELDALLLECQWIAEYAPLYNTALTHRERYGYIQWMSNAQIKWSKKVNKEAEMVIGPLTHASLAKKGYRYLKYQYPYFFCGYKKNSCGKGWLGSCPEYCQTKHNENQRQIWEDFLNLNNNIEEQLMRRVQQCSEYMEFERARELYEELKGVKYIRTIYHLLKDIETGCYIGVLETTRQGYNKYYIILYGRIIETAIASANEHKATVRKLKLILKQRKEEEKKAYINRDEVDEMLIIARFKRNRMQIINV